MLQRYSTKLLHKELWSRNVLLHHVTQLEKQKDFTKYELSKRDLDIQEYSIWKRYGIPPLYITEKHWVEKIKNTSTFLQDPNKDFFISCDGNIHYIKKNRIVHFFPKTPSKKIQLPSKISNNTSICICSMSNAKYLQQMITVLT